MAKYDAVEPPARLTGSWQEITFAASLTMQLTTIVITSIALTQSGTPEVLRTILTLEIVIQVVEFVWYFIVGMLYVTLGWNVEIATRYIDWVWTTPLMLISLMFFSIFEADRCVTNVDLLGDGSRVVALASLIIFDWQMIAVGAAYELKGSNLADWFSGMLDSISPGFSGLWLGFVPLVAAFVPLFVIAGEGASKTAWGIVSVSLTFVLWIAYGMVALFVNNVETKNTAYNLLDIVSKNVVGIIIASVALSNDFSTVVCPP